MRRWGSVVAGLCMAAICGSAAASEVNVYSYRQPELIEPLFKAFTKKTGVKVNMVYAQAGLLERLKAEGARSPADIVLSSDLTRLIEVVDAGLSAPVQSPSLVAAIPAQYRDPDGRWYGLTMRARIIYASKERVPVDSIRSYLDLAKPEWRQRICTRPGDHPYNLGLIAGMISRHGVDKTRAWLLSVKANLAQKPQGNDRSQVKGIHEGLCDVSLGNTYYMGKMLADPKETAWAQSVYMVFPDQNSGGTHVNISGATVLKAAPNRAEAVKLLEFLATEEAQRIYADANSEYPVRQDVAPSALVAAWGKFKADTVGLADVAKLQGDALRLVNETRFNDGP
ncbi:Fe(3+) ABC transporter substrate-binding protein [Iodidimonas sp. SYSU 1G8]|uniref:Fe(3+) ABC transporter substrate-binding protein n=1 Tax=Iodidimonas sp. SYSU 1G8 TaxID=3133967 RepID=UPI0031FE6949